MKRSEKCNQTVCLVKTVLADEPAAFPGSPTILKSLTSARFKKTFDLRSLAAYEPRKHRCDVCSSVRSVQNLGIAHSCRTVLVSIHRPCLNESITSTYFDICASLPEVELQLCLLLQILSTCFEKIRRHFQFPPHRQASTSWLKRCKKKRCQKIASPHVLKENSERI